MKRVRSIFGIFTVFLLIILASFLLLSWQSTANLKASLIQTAQLQTKYAATLLEQKGKEIEIENCASHSRYFSDELDAQFF